MDDPGCASRPPRPRRESPATYRRRRLAAAGLALVLLGAVTVGLSRLAGDGDEAAAEVAAGNPEPPAPTRAPGTTTAPDGAPTPGTTSAPDPGTTATTTPAPPTTVVSAAVPSTTGATTVGGFASAYEFLACVRARESRGNYAAVSAGGGFFGAYQIDQVTWDSTAEHAGMGHLLGIQPNHAPPASQDAIAFALLEWQGAGPWAGGCIPPAPGT